MRRKTRRGAATGVLLALAAARFMFAPPLAVADTTTTTFNVSATVTTACAVSATDLAFGSYDPTASSPTDSTSAVSVRCTLGTTYHVRLGQGLHGTGVTNRQMQRSGSTEKLAYGLYSDAAHLLNWGESDGVDTVDGVGTGLVAEHAVYGRIAAQQAVPAVAYADTITVTVSY